MDEKFKNFVYFREVFFPTANANIFETHMHAYYELYYFLQGNADYVVGNTIYHLQPHDLLFIRPSVYHCLKPLSDSPYRRIVINFFDEQIDKDVMTFIDQLLPHYRVPVDSLLNQYFTNGINISNHYNNVDLSNCLIKYVNLILTEMKYTDEFANKEPPAHIHPTFSKIIDYIDNNLNLQLTIQDISKEFFVSPSWIMHSFRKFLNTSAKEYITTKKILHAQQLIKSGIPIAQAAELCGYRTYPSFFIQYKKIFGKAPSQ